ncbi:hypothetical protein HY440_02690 [Candidatus Microgenomates bacterium]|nr:hypothetical protein [Candidatus Microgenomates bacterium]
MMPPVIPPKYIYIVLGFIGAIFVANVLLLDYFLVGQRNDLVDFQTKLTQLSDNFRVLGGRLYGLPPVATPSGTTSPLSILNPVNNLVCPTSCVDLIALSTEAGRVSTRSLINSTYTPTTSTVATTKGEFFVPLGSGSVDQTSDWTNINSAQATFDASNFGSIKAAYFEAFLRRSTTASGEVFARLFDSTTPAILWGSEMSTSANTSTFISKAISLSGGQKVYKVQMYSTNGVSYLDQARIRIVTQ